MASIKAACEQLRNTKVKARGDALTTLTTAFQSNHVLETFANDSDGETDGSRNWIYLFQSLFSCVIEERKIVMKDTKGTSTAERRLAQATGLVRSLIERAVHLFEKRVTELLYTHMNQTMAYKGELVPNVALNYIKATKALLSYRAHLDYLKTKTWIETLERAFNVVLGDHIATNWIGVGADETMGAHSPSVAESTDQDDDTDVEAGTATLGKRRRNAHEPKRKKFKAASVSLEQVEFNSVIRILVDSSYSPLLDLQHLSLSSEILLQCQRFLDAFPPDCSLYDDFLQTLITLTSHLALNRKDQLLRFARRSWGNLVALWGTKNKRLKESLVVVLRALLPYVTAPDDPGSDYDWSDAVWKLWRTLDSSNVGKWGSDGLPLDAIRLEITHQSRTAFVRKTFKAASDITADTALAWAILELQADCAAKLHQFSESHVAGLTTPRPDGKRSRIEDPMRTLINALHDHSLISARVYRLQLLLFIVDQHWSSVHEDLQQFAKSQLGQGNTGDDYESWTFLCLAAIAHHEAYHQPAMTMDSQTQEYAPVDSLLAKAEAVWGPLWTTALRRASVPAVSRAATHLAHVLISSYVAPRSPISRLLSSRIVLGEIETFIKDISVQGPPFPFDSACMLIFHCLRIANQDLRLYRMQFEDKVLSWLVDCWTLVGGPRTSAADVLLLLMTICDFSKQYNLPMVTLLPDCQIVGAVVDEQRTLVLREFLLSARLATSDGNDQVIDVFTARRPDGQLAQAGKPARKISAFFLRNLEHTLNQLEQFLSQTIFLKAENARAYLEMAVAALWFDTHAILNNIESNQRVAQYAFKIIDGVTSQLPRSSWTTAEKATILLALQPLICYRALVTPYYEYLPILPPNEGTGIKLRLLKELSDRYKNRDADSWKERLPAQRGIWLHPHRKETFEHILRSLRDVFHQLTADHGSAQAVEADDEFGKETHVNQTQTESGMRFVDSADAISCIGRICVGFLTQGPFMQSSSDTATRDEDLVEYLLDCRDTRPDRFLLLYPLILQSVHSGTLVMTSRNLYKLLDALGEQLRYYDTSKAESWQSFAVMVLTSTVQMWLSLKSNVKFRIQKLCGWISTVTAENKIGSWRVRDAVALLFDRYLSIDSEQLFWPAQNDAKALEPPLSLLNRLLDDADIRIRFRAASLNAKTFALARKLGQPESGLYHAIYKNLSILIDSYESMLTRFLALGNIMVTSSAVRRGAYWHILETCFETAKYSQRYFPHIAAILRAVSERLGLKRFASLFEIYAPQLAVTVRNGGHDFLRMPPELLGYESRREAASASFAAFTPANLVADDSKHIKFGRRVFDSYCNILQKSNEEGITDCFGDIAAWYLLSTPEAEDALESFSETLRLPARGSFQALLEQNVDSVAVAVLSTLADGGPIELALKEADDTAVEILHSLLQYRASSHGAIINESTGFSAQNIVRVLAWLQGKTPSSHVNAVTYHVLHNLFARLHQSPLVREQLRLFEAICLWVAYNHKLFSNPTLSHMLIHGGCSLMAQSDLARPAQSLLSWAFQQYCEGKPDPRFPDILLRTCCQVYDYSCDPDGDISQMGVELLKWMGEQAVHIATRSSKFSAQILSILPAWPNELSPPLADLFNHISADDLSIALSNSLVKADKFRIVRRLFDRDLKSFGSTYFWRLKECIPVKANLRDDDARAFAELLVRYKGSIDSFGENQVACTPRFEETAEHTVLRSLLILLDDRDPHKVHTAYLTLRSIMHGGFIRPHIKEYSAEMELLQMFPRPPISTEVVHLEQALTEVTMLEACSDFSLWVGKVSVLLSGALSSSSSLYAQLRTILMSDAIFAESLLPVLVWGVLLSELQERQCKDMTDLTSRPQSVALSNYLAAVLRCNHATLECHRSVVGIVLHLLNRGPPRPADQEALSYEQWLHLDYHLLARTAISCGSYTTALLFLEVAANRKQSSQDGSEQIMYEIYSHIDEPDGFYGIKDQNHQRFLINSFHHEKQWDKAFRFHGAALEADKSNSSESDGMLQSFHAFGFNTLAATTLQGATSGSPIIYDLGWRTQTWDLPDPQQCRAPGNALYVALRATHRERNVDAVNAVLRNVLLKEMQHLRGLGSENITEIREAVQSLMCLSQVISWFDQATQANLRSDNFDTSNIVKLEPGFQFTDAENIMATRISLIRAARQNDKNVGNLLTPFATRLLSLEKGCLLHVSALAREASQNQIALNAVVSAQRLESSAEVSEEFSQVLWLLREEKRAVQLLTDLRGAALPGQLAPIHLATINARLGSWTAQACLQKPSYTLKEFFHPAMVSAEQVKQSLDGSQSLGDIYHQCAVFAHHQYHAILHSPDVLRRKLYLDLNKKTLQTLEQGQKGAKREDAKVLAHQIEKTRKVQVNDQAIYNQYVRERDSFLELAIHMYSHCLEICDTYDGDANIRLCSLWLANFDDPNLKTNKVKTSLCRIPSRKFVFLAHQLSARLGPIGSSAGQSLLQSLLKRMCEEHPFHSLYQVFCLTSPSRATERSQSAKEIFDQLTVHPNQLVRNRVLQIEKLSRACLKLAEYSIEKGSAKTQAIPNTQAIMSIRDFSVPPITARLPLDSTMRYDDLPSIKSYDKTIQILGGINLPKICTCLATDGRRYKQLFKNNDDMRQDAVMEQVFELCNSLLHRDRETRRRRLLVRDYKVIPLASQAGVIEFVDNTDVLSDWLTVSHKRYNPKEAGLKEGRDAMNKVAGESAELRIKKFIGLQHRIRPVLRHYFTEAHRKPSAWFAMRLNYVRSVATSSIVGHVLGLGDRHCSNILIDKISGEVIHIDLGIAFDQGKLLRVPETVPFRMTADIVDGMGISETDGVFQRCAEESLRVLREDSEVIMTVLEVFRHDPLHNWTANEDKMNRVQADTDTTNPTTAGGFGHGIEININSGVADEAADRALSSVARKLSKELSVTSAVSGLIAEARDPANLGVIFYGWAPFF